MRVLAKYVLVFLLAAGGTLASAQNTDRIVLNNSIILVDSSEPSYVWHGANDLASYLSEITGKEVVVSSSVSVPRNASTIIAVGGAMARTMGAELRSELGTDGSIIRSLSKSGMPTIVVAGLDPRGTNTAIATLMRLIRADGKIAYVKGPLDLVSKPSYAIRGIHLNGWPLNYPYGFRAWKEADWKKFVDIAWAQRINLLFIWPFMEILPVPLSADDAAYLQEVHRVIEYAQNERGMQVWIMQSANRIGITDCGSKNPRFRTYWVNECQKDMNPAEPQQFARILESFQALYSIVNNADAYVMIDSDPGSWPQSPISDQLKIFHGARKLLDEYSVHKKNARLVDWMHVGWGRHKFFTSADSVVAAYDWTDKNPDKSDVAFMDETIRSFKAYMPEPWSLIAGQPPYLDPVQMNSVLDKTVYLPYGAIESEPAFPATNLGQESVRKVFDRANRYPGLRGVMGNNQLMLLQFPRTFYFFSIAWDKGYEQMPEKDVMLDLAGQLYPEQAQLIADAFLALRQTNSGKIAAVLARLSAALKAGSLGRPGPLGRFLFPDRLAIARNLQMQLEIRRARQSFLEALNGKPNAQECARLLENYFDKLLAWNRETGWDKMIDITVWPHPIYEKGEDLTKAVYHLKQILGQGAPYTSYAKINTFFSGIAAKLLPKYGQDSVMVGCIEPFKLAVVQSQ